MDRYDTNGLKTIPGKPQKNIMVVEDDLDLLGVYRGILEADAWTVMATTTCKDACLRLIAESAPDIIILDLGLPDCDGIEIIETIKKGGIHTHVIVVSGCGDIQRAVSCVHAGAAEFMEKPIDPENFLRIINRYHGTPTHPHTQGDRRSQSDSPTPLTPQIYPTSPTSLAPITHHPAPPMETASQTSSRRNLYVFVAAIALISLAFEFVFMEYLEYQSKQRTETLQTLITQSIRALNTRSQQASDASMLHTDEIIEEFARAIKNSDASSDVVKAINKYKKKKKLSSANDFKKFYLTHFAIQYWHVTPEAFLQGLREANIPAKLMPGTPAELLAMKKTHIRLLTRFIRHLNATKYKKNVVPKEDRRINAYRIKGDIDYGGVIYGQKDKKKLIALLRKYITTLRLGSAQRQPSAPPATPESSAQQQPSTPSISIEEQ